jgi:hypothetical protein
MSEINEASRDLSEGVDSEIQLQIQAVIPKEREAYYRDMQAKHFNRETGVGSLFTEVASLEELLEVAIKQRGNLFGDDREKFIEMGVDPMALLASCRYLMVQTPGEVGIVRVKDLSPDTQVKVIRTKVGVPCSLVVEGNEFPKTNFGTIIIGPNQRQKPEDPAPSTSEMVWTAHPGLPVRPVTEDYWEEGSVITVQDVIDKLGQDIYLNVKKIV